MKDSGLCILLLPAILALQACGSIGRTAPQQVIAVQRGASENFTLAGRIRHVGAPASDMLPTYYVLQLARPLQMMEKAGWDASLCDPQAALDRIELWYSGYAVFADLPQRELTLTGKIDCPRGSYVFRDIDFTLQDGGLIRDAVKAHSAGPLP